MKIEFQLAELNGNKNGECEKLINAINSHIIELDTLYAEKSAAHNRNSLYNDKIMVPCLFNSGSVIGKRGATGIEISKGRISLVYWFDKNRSKRYLDYDGVTSKQMGKTNFYKAILKRD